MNEISWNWDMWQKPSTPITEEEYYEWLKDAVIVEPHHFTFTSMCGPHEASTIIIKNGKYYDLGDGFCAAGFFGSSSFYEKSKIKDGYELWWSIKELYVVPNQNGDGI